MQTDEQTKVSWGIDISKERLDIASWPATISWQVRNDASGWTTLIDRATREQPERIVLEASGGYETGVVLALDAAGFTPVVLNPTVARRFAQSHGHLAKTDRIDAGILARFGAERQPDPRPIPSETMRKLAALLALRNDFVSIRSGIQNRRHQAETIVRSYLDHQHAELSTQINEIEADLAALVRSDLAITATVTLLMTVKGIGRLLATTLAVGVPELGLATHKELAALVGVAPFANDSGKRRGHRSIRGGRRTVRRALYQAVLTMITWDPHMRAYYQRLRANQKPPKVAMVACMNKLIGLLNAMVRTGCRWEELDFNQPPI